jgi:hypothetical protein
MLGRPENLAMEQVFGLSVLGHKRLVLEPQVHRYTECRCTLTHALPCHPHRQFGEAVASGQLATERDANSVELVLRWTLACGLTPFHGQAILVLAALERRTVNPPVLLDLRPWHMAQNMMAVRDYVTLRHAPAP